MITTCLQSFTRGCQGKLLSSSELLVQCAPRLPLLVGAYEKFFACLKLINDVGVVDVTNVMDGDPPTPIDGEG